MDWPYSQAHLPILQHKWVTAVLECLRQRPRRAAELRSELGVSGKVLNQTMNSLVAEQVAQRSARADGTGAVYELAERGRAMVTLLDRLEEACVKYGIRPYAVPSTKESEPSVSEPGGAAPAAHPLGKALARRMIGPTRPDDRGGVAAAGQLPFDRPNTARMYDYYLGGKENFAADRDAADRVLSAAPEAAALAVENRRFLFRVIRYLADLGIDQFIDLGSGLPTQQNVHVVAQRYNPDSRVVYVDNDPVVLTHARALLSGTPRAVVVEGDVRAPDAIIDHPDVRALIDLSRPIGVLMVFVLHCLSDADDPWSVVARISARLPVGSHVVISHVSYAPSEDQAAAAERVYRDAQVNAPVVHRERAAVQALFNGLEFVQPGLTWIPEWRPELSAPKLSTPWPDPGADSLPHWVLAGVGRVPAGRRNRDDVVQR